MHGMFGNVETEMERAVAIKKLGKILGKSLGYRVDTTAPTQDERGEAQAKLPAATVVMKSLNEQMDGRRSAILKADPEYQRLKVEYEAARKHRDKLLSITNHYKITVGVSNSLFFIIKAQGDSWEDVIGKLTEKQAA